MTALKKIVFDHLPFFVGLLSGIYFISSGSLSPGLAHFPGDLADARFNNYILEHGYLFCKGEVTSFWSAPFIYPEKSVITYSDNHLGSLPFYMLCRLFSSDRETAFQYWYLLTCALNYTGAFFLLRYLFKNHFAAACGAMIFAFSIALQSQMGHAQTYSRFMIPLSIWAALLFIRDLKVKFFLLMGLSLVYQFYCGFYLGFMLFVPVAVMMLLSLYFRRGLYALRIRSRSWNLRMAGSVFLCILLILPVVIPYIERAKQTGFYPYQQIRESLPTFISFFYSHHGSLFWDFINNIGVHYPAFWDHQIFPGGVAIVSSVLCFLFILFRKQLRSPRFLVKIDLNTKVLLITSVITFILFLRIGDFSFYRLIYPLPGFGSMRALQRIINVELIFMAMAVAFIFQLFFEKRNAVALISYLLFTVLIIGDNRIHPDTVHKWVKSEAQQRVALLKSKIGTATSESVLSYEPDTMLQMSAFYQLDAMLAAQDLGIKTMNGYTATSPANFSPYWIHPDEKSRRLWIESNGLDEQNIIVVR